MLVVLLVVVTAGLVASYAALIAALIPRIRDPWLGHPDGSPRNRFSWPSLATLPVDELTRFDADPERVRLEAVHQLKAIADIAATKLQFFRRSLELAVASGGVFLVFAVLDAIVSA